MCDCKISIDTVTITRGYRPPPRSTLNAASFVRRFTSSKNVASIFFNKLTEASYAEDGPMIMDADEEQSRKSKSNRAIGVGALVIFGGLIAVATPFVLAAREAARRNVSMKHIEEIGHGMQSYHSAQMRFPAVALRDDAGNPLLSWRVLITRYCGEEAAVLGNAFKKNEPWNSPANMPLAERAPMIYVAPQGLDFNHGETNVLAVVDLDTVITPDGQVNLRDIADGAANTILAVELQDSGVIWSEPRDLTIDEFIAAMKRQPGEPGPRPIYRDVVMCLYADGGTRGLPIDTTPEMLRALCTRAGGENAQVGKE